MDDTYLGISESHLPGKVIVGKTSGETGSTEKDGEFGGRTGDSMTLKEVWYNFSQNTTLHGVQNITADTPYKIRRIFWILLVLGGFTFFMYQLVVSTMAYREYQVNLKVNRRNNESIKFPAVTLCNQNTFRASSASRGGHYKLVRDYYSKLEDGGIDLEDYNAANTTLADLYKHYHTAEDFIIGCEWDNNITCSAADFVMSKTDYGYCFTFNGPGRPGGPLTMSSEGMERGLKLTLNVEQYEYMIGPNAGAGIKLLLHDQDDVPLVGNVGQAIPPGSFGYIGYELTTAKMMEPPHGKCNRSAGLEYYDTYSVPACKVECRMKHMLRTCGCIEPYMPSINGVPPVCDLKTYQKCFMYASENFQDEDCSCTVPCDSTHFHSRISYGSVSNIYLQNLIRTNNISHIKDSYIFAQEVRSKEEEYQAEKDRNKIYSFERSLWNLDHALQERFIRTIKGSQTKITELMQEWKAHSKFHTKKGLGILEFIVVNEFIRGVTVNDERTFMFLTPNYNEISAYIKDAYPRIANTSESDMTRLVLYENVKSDLFKMKTAAQRANEKMTFILESYRNVTPVVQYRATPDSRYDDFYITKAALGSESQMNSLEVHGSEYMLHVNYLLADIHGIEDLLQEAYTNGTQGDDIMNEYLDKDRKGLIYQAERINYRLYRVKHFTSVTKDVVEGLVSTLKREEEFVENLETEVMVFLEEMSDTMNIADEYYKILHRVSQRGAQYLAGNATKTNLADLILTEGIKSTYQLLETTVGTTSDHIISVSSKLSTLLTGLQHLWKVLLEGHELQNLYMKLKEDIDKLVDDIEAENGRLKEIVAEFAEVDVSFVESNTLSLYKMTNADFSLM